MDLLNLAVDKKAEESGVWVRLDSETRIKVARLGNAAYAKKLQRIKGEANVVYIPLNTDDNAEENNDNVLKAMAGTVLVDWEGMKSDGKDLEFSEENAYTAMKDYPEFAKGVINISTDVEKYRLKVIEKDKKK